MVDRMPWISSPRSPTPSPVYDTYWRFAALRQDIFHRRLRGQDQPWTNDPVLQEHRFTNAYRASDRVSQYLIREVVYSGSQDPDEVIFRVLLFKFFNKVATWELLARTVGPPTLANFSVDDYDRALTAAFDRGERIYSAAYIMPAAMPGPSRKHRTHLMLLQQMLTDRLADRLVSCGTMREAYELLRSYRGIGAFLAYQLVTDLNYSRALNYSEMEFVMPGPGAASGIAKCFTDPGDYSPSDLIRYVTERQQEEFRRREIPFEDLWGRQLQLIDCQNLFCEVDKYSRIVHPDVQGIGGRSRIKQRFAPSSEPLFVWFPPKWGLNARIESKSLSPAVRSNAPEGRLRSARALAR